MLLRTEKHTRGFHLDFFFINAGRKLAQLTERLALVESVTSIAVEWLCICIAEFDFSLCTTQADGSIECGRHLCIRHYCGVGTTPMAIIINACFSPLFRSIEWGHRCGSAFFSTNNLAVTDTGHRNMNFSVIFVHCMQREKLEESFPTFLFWFGLAALGEALA